MTGGVGSERTTGAGAAAGSGRVTAMTAETGSASVTGLDAIMTAGGLPGELQRSVCVVLAR